MIHMLKASSKPIGTEYKRRIVPLAGSLSDFQAEQQKVDLQAEVRSKASKKKKGEKADG